MAVTSCTIAMAIKPGLDTNILIYSVDLRDMRKHDLCERLVARCGSMDAVLSLQCLTEFYRATTRKKILPRNEASSVVQQMRDSFRIVAPTEADLVTAMRDYAAGQVQFFDALLCATLDRAGCTILFSEDLNHRQQVGGLQILNPFLLTATDLDRLLA